MSNFASSYGLPSGPVQAGYGGTISAQAELPVSRLRESYTVDGSGSVSRLTALPRGVLLTLYFTGSPTFVNSSRLVCQGGVNLTPAAGDIAVALSLGDGNWRLYRVRSGSAPLFADNNLSDVLAPATARDNILAAPYAALVPFGRLTLTSGTAITEADVTAATNIYFTPTANDAAPIFDGTNFVPKTFAELTLALDSSSGHTGYHQSGKNFFLGVFNDAGTIRLGSSVAWSGDATVGTGAGTAEFEIYQGRMVNKVSMTVRFGSASGNTVTVPARQFLIVGGFRASADGQTTDSKTKRLLSNLYNSQPRQLFVADATQTTYAYSTLTVRQARADTNNKAAIFNCSGGRLAEVNFACFVTTSSGSLVFPTIYIGLDSTTTQALNSRYGIAGITSAAGTTLRAEFKGPIGIGYHELVMLEMGASAGTTTFDPTKEYSNLMGEVIN